jgi:uncharacterized membrane protein
MKLLKFSLIASLTVTAITFTTPSHAGCWKDMFGNKICDPFGGTENTPIEDIDRELSNFEKTVRSYLQQGLVPPIIREYFTYLDTQARYKQIPSDIRRILTKKYPGVSINSIRYAENVDTVHGQAITVGYKIYFPSSVDFSNDNDLHWLLHEIEHVSQYQAHGGVEPFLIKYLVNGAIEIGRNGSIDIHDAINLERDAENKANSILDSVILSLRGFNYKFTNKCSLPVRLAVRYKNLTDEWITRGWWNFEPGESSYLSSSGNRLASRNSIYYYYAETTEDLGVNWSGNEQVSFDGRTLKMIRKKDNDGHNNWSISCENIDINSLRRERQQQQIRDEIQAEQEREERRREKEKARRQRELEREEELRNREIEKLFQETDQIVDEANEQIRRMEEQRRRLEEINSGEPDPYWMRCIPGSLGCDNNGNRKEMD